MIWRLGEPRASPRSACCSAPSRSPPAGLVGRGPRPTTRVGFAESARNLLWISLLYSLSAAGEERQHGLRLVYARLPRSSVFS